MSPRIKTAQESPGNRSRVRIRPRVWLALACLLALGVAARVLWQGFSPRIARQAQYRLTSDDIHITAPPAWIRADIKTEALRDAGLIGSFSMLDDREVISKRIKEAFEFHPWVSSVERITARPPGSLEIELKYRRPVAAVEVGSDSGIMFLPVDEQAVRLPDGDFTDVERRYLPRIVTATEAPLVGDSWNDSRVIGAAKLAAALADIWQQLRLVEIVARHDTSSVGPNSRSTFEIITSGGTRILWGAAPGEEASIGESPLEQKRQRLLNYAAKHGHLDSIEGPGSLDVRTQLIVTPRTARKTDGDGALNAR